jgi:hypothetical protein
LTSDLLSEIKELKKGRAIHFYGKLFNLRVLRRLTAEESDIGLHIAITSSLLRLLLLELSFSSLLEEMGKRYVFGVIHPSLRGAPIHPSLRGAPIHPSLRGTPIHPSLRGAPIHEIPIMHK